MSLNVKHLNGDSTFLLTFASAESDPTRAGYAPKPGTFTVLVDPWLDASDSTIFHSKFALARRTVPSCVNHLSEMPPPHLVLISQDKSDHCHEATLRQLDPALRQTVILAQPAAAKKIRGWKYFNPAQVHALPIYSDCNPSSIVRFQISASTPGSLPGEATISFIPAKRDITGLHNAIGITYRPPSSRYPLTAPTSPLILSHSAANFSAYNLPAQASPSMQNSLLTPPESPNSTNSTTEPFSPSRRPGTSPSVGSYHFPRRSKASSISSTVSSSTVLSTSAPFRPKTMSVIYSPHGITYHHIRPYATTHLVTEAALPLTLLLHSFDWVQNKWYLGGNINMGMAGGLEIAQNLLTRCWISTHDEDKESSGVSVRSVVTRKHTVAEVRARVEEDRRKGGRVGLEVLMLDCGKEVQLSV